jgi:hypothetical protein
MALLNLSQYFFKFNRLLLEAVDPSTNMIAPAVSWPPRQGCLWPGGLQVAGAGGKDPQKVQDYRQEEQCSASVFVLSLPEAARPEDRQRDPFCDGGAPFRAAPLFLNSAAYIFVPPTGKEVAAERGPGAGCRCKAGEPRVESGPNSRICQSKGSGETATRISPRRRGPTGRIFPQTCRIASPG